ncbi:clostripain-related cysteine peptidase [Capnocytophaga sp.]|uniref:clostripain-related cysteine peptidase n=1 Tax=Capnocytophaga sp. TaxID=44737 RepID=UPI0026DB4EA4|nr:clostripain-related cysteine peptidase [Capnocytophaga sp.]MDO5105793.1 clostripain-related cysteine peptidase [Capnocytophaga sp.]
MRFYILLALTALLFSCQSENLPNKQPQKHEITLVYMIADNDLAPYALKDINEMERAFIPNGRDKWLVYIDTYASAGLPQHPVLLEITPDTSDEVKSKIIYTYPEQNSADKHVFQSVLKDAFSVYRGTNHPKGLVLWSHGNAWLPNDYHIDNNRNTAKNITTPFFKSFGKDNVPTDSAMEITELAESLTPYHFDYLLFDACFMASIEVLYELRHTADFFIASPAEILADGFPYQQIIPYLTNNLQLEKAVKTYYEYYASQKGAYQSATVTLINGQFLEHLAQICRKITTEMKKTTKLQIDDLQQYSRNNEKLLFDLKQILHSQPNAIPEINDCWQKLCKVEKHTTKMANLSLDNCHGISAYLFNSNTSLNESYKQLSWYKTTNLASYFGY